MPDTRLKSTTTYWWQRPLARFFGRKRVELTIGALIVLSVVLTLIEFFVSADPRNHNNPVYRVIKTTNLALTWLFIVELFLRYAAVISPRRFIREYWIDLVAVLPTVVPQLGTARLMRLIRLLRILRLFGFVQRFSSNFPYILRRGAVEYVTVCGLLVFTVLLGSGAMVFAEGGSPDRDMSFREAFWFTVYSLFAGEPVPDAPRTVGGQIVAVCVMFMGLTIFAMFTGTVSAFMVERLRTKGRTVDWDQFEDHIIICGWNSKAEIILEEHQAAQSAAETPIVVIAQFDHDPPSLVPSLQSRVVFLEDDFTRVPVLERAGIHRARTCIILADTTGGRSEQDADARTILAALTVEKLNAAVYTCAELHNSEYGSHLEMGQVNDYVVSSEHSAYLLAQAAMNKGLVGVFTELLTFQRGNQFYRSPIPSLWVGRNFEDLFLHIRREQNAILVAIHRADGEMRVNPRDYIFAAGDEIVAIADHDFQI